MFLTELRTALLQTVRTRVRNGELTERGLSRLIGISQPHVHNVLKGTRLLSLELSDQFLSHLRLSVLDLIDPSILHRYMKSEHPDASLYSVLPVLQGKIGPAHPWPSEVDKHERYPVPLAVSSAMWHPVVVRVSEDLQMYPLFADGDRLLLDQAHRARTEIDPDALYVIKRGRVGLVRRLRMIDRAVYMVSEDALPVFTRWERLPVEGQTLTHFVRARATLLAKELEWEDAGGMLDEFQSPLEP